MGSNDKLRQVLRTALDEVLDDNVAKKKAEIMAIASVIRDGGDSEMKDSSMYACHVTALSALALKELVAEHDARLAADIAAMSERTSEVEENHMAADDMLLQIAEECGYVKTVEAYTKITKWYA